MINPIHSGSWPAPTSLSTQIYPSQWTALDTGNLGVSETAEFKRPHQKSVELTWPQRIYNYVGPIQAIGLFAGGAVASLGLGVFVRGLLAPNLDETLLRRRPGPLDTWLEKLRKERQTQNGKTPFRHETVEESVNGSFQGGLVSVLTMAIQHPELQKGLIPYLGATGVGYVLGCIAEGIQEVLVRKEETQIRANLIQRLQLNFRKSIQTKTESDNRLRQEARERVVTLLARHGIPNPERYVYPNAMVKMGPLYRFPYEPVNFSFPQQLPLTYRFGKNQSNLNFASDTVFQDDPSRLLWLKSSIFGIGFLAGTLGQVVLGLLKRPQNIKLLNQSHPTGLGIFFNLNPAETLFLLGNKLLLCTVLALTAGAKMGKMLIDGYREIEVTRQHAITELRYQSYNWLAMDPGFHRIAEREALEDGLHQLDEAVPFEASNHKVLEQRVQTLLTNIGRNSAPKYFQMTPMVNLAPART